VRLSREYLLECGGLADIMVAKQHIIW